ncbi:pilus assembly protein [Aquirhabdus parva]|uniref:Pilus assembly protein PilY n=1 Tax=Aquirhabdus parva TaxID=2283318 RepID=A0A345P2L2_9GAMM|nr:pilus assembly protein PilY [Aquirhabdus parva]AXI01521.1 pilus assembly protein PilY [Aquirhabdus parva]
MSNQVKRVISREKYLKVCAALISYLLATLISTAASASDLEIYQKPTAGKKTLIMMLDTSGSMSSYDDGTACAVDRYNNEIGYTDSTGDYPRYYCSTGSNGTGTKYYQRITRLQDGMYAVLNSTDPKLNNVVMGVGNFSDNYNTNYGKILVKSDTLGPVGSAQRTALKSAIAGLVANSYTPTAHAYAEAAAYLMGTTTYSETLSYPTIAVQRYKLVRSYTVGSATGSFGNRRYPYTYSYSFYTCATPAPTNFSNNTQSCSDWGNPTNTTGTSSETSNSSPTWANSPTIPTNDGRSGSGTSSSPYIYIVNGTQTRATPNPDSGVPYSVSSAKSGNNYISPLPASTARASCDGQGIYILSDGVPNNSSSDEAAAVMNPALTSTYSDSTANLCPSTGGLPLTSSDSTWNCIGEFSKRLYDPTKNPSGVSIKTAFVGFGTDFGSIATASPPSDVLNACHLGSNLKGDACSPQVATAATNPNANPASGYGNGGFYLATTPDNVTGSVLNFIDNLGTDAINPLVTGAPTVPIDSLNPNGFQPYGYLRLLEPNPAKTSLVLWRGNVKKYNVSGGTLTDASGTTVLTASGTSVSGTKDLWNSTSTADGGIINTGGAYAKVPMPLSGTPNKIRALFTDVASAASGVLTGIVGNGSDVGVALTPVPGVTPTALTDIPSKFIGSGAASPLKDLSTLQQKVLINYLGYNLPLDSTAIPASLPTPGTSASLAMGGSIHAQPIQLTYASTLNADGSLSARTESVLYGSMEGALHLVDAGTGAEQMAFVPMEILANSPQLTALSVGATDQSATPNTPAQGVDGPWVADPAYTTSKGSTIGSSSLTASQMNVYGGLRMGGNSYYGLNLKDFAKAASTTFTPTPRLLFRIDKNSSGFGRMGQTWSKPVLANIRYNNAITRVMIVGGGYDPQYESPSYVPTASAPAQGNTVYMVNAKTGALIWSAVDATNTNSNLIHSIVGRVSAIDRDADGLVDSIYFADLGGQLFRADFNNTYGTSTSKFGVRVTRLADLATSTQKTNGTNPRFYAPVTVTIHDQGVNTFALIGLASGNRSSPLDVIDVSLGGRGLRSLPVNNVYGIIDRDLARRDLIKLSSDGSKYINTNGTTFSSATVDKTLSNLQQNPQSLTGDIPSTFFPANSSTTAKDGWYRSLSSTSNGTEKADGSFRYPGGIKAFEDEPIAITGLLKIPVYDPQGTGVPAGNPCDPRVVGETDAQTYCLPYGVCLTSTGAIDTTKQSSTGFQLVAKSSTDATLVNGNVLGAGIRGFVLGDGGASTDPNATCRNITLIGNTAGAGTWNCARKLVPTMWYEKKPNISKVQ